MTEWWGDELFSSFSNIMHSLKIHLLEEKKKKDLCVRDFSYVPVFLLSFTLQCLSLAFDFHGNELL